MTRVQRHKAHSKYYRDTMHTDWFNNDDPSEHPVWLISFTDLMALMLTFFVLLFAMTKPDPQSWSDIRATLEDEFYQYNSRPAQLSEKDSLSLPRTSYSRAHSFAYLTPLLRSQLKTIDTLQGVEITEQPDRLLISLPDDLLFESGSATLTKTGNDIIYQLSPMLNQIRNATEIAGHADPRPITNSDLFATNWELSLARATSVAISLYNNGYDKNLRVQGFSSKRYNELDEGLSEDVRLSLSRRVDIVILKHDGSQHRRLGFVQ